MSIFDNISRQGDEPPLQSETAFGYLNRSGRPEAARVRVLIDAWLSHYPTADRDALIARLRSTIDDQHNSAYFELLLHELMLVNGHRIVAIEPKLEHTPRSPDFLVAAKEGHCFYLEAVLATGRSQEEIGAQSRLNQALAAIDRTPSPRHFLDLHVRGMPAQPVSINRMKRALEAWIAGLADDDTSQQAAPFIWQEHGVRIMLTAFPRHNRERTGRAIGVRHFPVQTVTSNEDVRTAIEKKASRYGTLDAPYVVGVNAFGLFSGEDDALDALFGTEAHLVQHMRDGTMRAEDTRNPDGVWHGPNGARKKGLSAVISTAQVTSWNFASRAARIIRNPWGTTLLPATSLGIAERNPVDGVLKRIDGSPLGAVFGLPDGWPGD